MGRLVDLPPPSHAARGPNRAFFLERSNVHGNINVMTPALAVLLMLVQTPRAEIERQYARLDSAIRRNDVAGILAIQAPSFTSDNLNGVAMDYAAMEARTRLMASLIDSVIHVRNTIRDFARRRDTVVVTVCQEYSRIQRVAGQPHRIDTSVLQRERWVRLGGDWKRERVDEEHGLRWFVDSVRIEPGRPYTPGAPPYAPNPDPPTGCGLL